MTNLKVQLSVQIPAGPTVQSTRTVAVDKYESFNLSLPPNMDGDSSAGIDRMPKSSEGPISLLMVQSSIYPTGGDAGEIKLTLGTTPIADKSLHEPLFLSGAQVISALGEIAQISFVNTYKPTKPAKKDAAAQKEAEAKVTLESAKTEEDVSEAKGRGGRRCGGKGWCGRSPKNGYEKVTEAEKALKEATDEVTKAIAAVEKEIAEHTAQLSILIGREAPTEHCTACRPPNRRMKTADSQTHSQQHRADQSTSSAQGLESGFFSERSPNPAPFFPSGTTLGVQVKPLHNYSTFFPAGSYVSATAKVCWLRG